MTFTRVSLALVKERLLDTWKRQLLSRDSLQETSKVKIGHYWTMVVRE